MESLSPFQMKNFEVWDSFHPVAQGKTAENGRVVGSSLKASSASGPAGEGKVCYGAW